MRAVFITGLLLVASLFIISSVDDLTRMVNGPRGRARTWWGTGRHPYGDLYSLSYLPNFRIPVPAEDVEQLTGAGLNTEDKTINLYALSDSYLWGLLDHPQLFNKVNQIKYVVSNTHNIQPIVLDTSKRNVLIMEVVERNVRPLFSDSLYLQSFLHFYKPGDDTSKIKTATYRARFHFKFKIKEIDNNIEYNVWDYRLFTPLKEAKAGFTYRYFNRTHKDVAVSADGKQLFYGPTVDTAGELSSFSKVSNAQLDDLVNNLNAAAAHYKKQGFKAVYLSVIPNPVTIMAPGFHGYRYNGLIPRLQQHPALELKVIDTYSAFVKSPLPLFLRNDTHWNLEGKKTWLGLVNDALRKE